MLELLDFLWGIFNLFEVLNWIFEGLAHFFGVFVPRVFRMALGIPPQRATASYEPHMVKHLKTEHPERVAEKAPERSIQIHNSVASHDFKGTQEAQRADRKIS